MSSNSSYYDPRKALYFAGQWSRLRQGSDAIPDTLDENLYSLGPDWIGDDEWGDGYRKAITPGKDGGRVVLEAVGTCTDGVGAGIVGTVDTVVANDHRTAGLVE